MFLVDLKKAFCRIERVEVWIQNKGIAKVLFGVMMSLYEVAAANIGVDSEWLGVFEFTAWINQACRLSFFLKAMIDVTDFAKLVLSEIHLNDDSLLMSEKIEVFWNKLLNSK